MNSVSGYRPFELSFRILPLSTLFQDIAPFNSVSGYCPFQLCFRIVPLSTLFQDGPFVWDKETQGLLLGAVYWGYMSSLIVASYFIYFFGARRVCVVSMLAMSAFTMLCPPAAYWSPWAVFVLRVAVGLCTVSGYGKEVGLGRGWEVIAAVEGGSSGGQELCDSRGGRPGLPVPNS